MFLCVINIYKTRYYRRNKVEYEGLFSISFFIFKEVCPLILFFGDNNFLYSIAQIILGLGYCVGAGADSKLIQKHAENIALVQSKTNGYMFLSLLISGLIGSFLFSKGIYLPFVVSMVATESNKLDRESRPTKYIKLVNKFYDEL